MILEWKLICFKERGYNGIRICINMGFFSKIYIYEHVYVNLIDTTCIKMSYIVDSIILVKVGSVLDFAHVSLVNSSSWLMGLLFMKNTIVI